MKITVGVPTHNEESCIISCLDSIVSQRDESDLEIIVVASGCTDKTVEKVEEYARFHKNVKLIVEDKRNGKISAINLILENARGDIIVHGGGDVLFLPGTINKFVKHMDNDQKVICVSGISKFRYNGSKVFYSWSVKTLKILTHTKILESRRGVFFHLCGDIFAHRNGAITKVPFVMGATDATMGSIIREKGKIIFDPSIKCELTPPDNVSDFINQKSRIRYGYLVLNQKMPSSRNMSSELKYLPSLFRGNSWLINICFLYVGLLYLASWMKAHLIFLKANPTIDEIWRPVVSTKKL